jgi:hypothetical protein
MRHFLIIALGGLLLTQVAHAQYELKAGVFNATFFAGPPTVANPPATSGQFAGVGEVSGSAGAIATAGPVADNYPSTANNQIVLLRASIGSIFATGLPRYALGDVITPPLVQVDGITPAADGYWRGQPVLPGETISGLGVPLPLGSVSVTSASTTSRVVTVASVPGQLIVGATLLGQPVTRVLGNAVTLAENANANISSPTAVDITPATPFYYSPHSEKVYASQPGGVSIIWVTRVAQGATQLTATETFAVSSSSTRTVRTIFWTEGTFDGPKVQIPDTQITTISPAYNAQVPKGVAEEVSIPGYSPASPNLTTLSFERFNGVGQIKAYNVEGRILVEYLGSLRTGNNVYVSKGTDVINMVRVPQVNNPTVHLGKELGPSNGDATLTPSPVLSTVQGGLNFYGTSARPDGTASYTAERETGPPNQPDNGAAATTEAYNKVSFYWMEQGQFGMQWPKFQDRYWLRWSPNLADYVHYTVDASGSTADNGINFSGGQLPQIVYQDAPSQTEAVINVNTQRFHITSLGADQRNRSLLKFTSASKTWYVPVYSQAQDRQSTLSATADVEPGVSLVTLSPGQSTAGFLAGTHEVDIYSGVTYIGPVSMITEVIDDTRFVIRGERTPGSFIFRFGRPGNPYYDFGGAGYPGVVSPMPSRTRTVASTSNLEVGMIVSGTGLPGPVTVSRIISGTKLELSATVPSLAAQALTFTVQADGGLPIDTTATVGTRLNPPAGHEVVGYISSGTGYYREGYVDPFSAGVAAASLGSIIPVNARPGNEVLTVRWFKKVAAPSADFQDLYVPGKWGRYTTSYPASTTPQIVIAQGIGTGDLPPDLATGSVYVQNDITQPGYNPNEEHAFIIGGRCYALREDLNITTGADYTSAPFVLLSYTNTVDKRPDMKAYKVVRSTTQYPFAYNATAGTLLVKPYPLPLMPLPLTGTGSARTSKDVEIISPDLPANGTVSSDSAYRDFTFKDRKGFVWVHRGSHSGKTLIDATYGNSLNAPPVDVKNQIQTAIDSQTNLQVSPTGFGIPDPVPNILKTLTVRYATGSGVETATLTDLQTYIPPTQAQLTMKLYYLSRAGFWVPGTGEPTVGTVLPFLRNPARSGQRLVLADSDVTEPDEPLSIIYRPTWPSQAAELRVGETLTLPKFGLPQVRGQISAKVYYEQSIATAATATVLTKNSVTLHDSTRRKTYPFADATLPSLPASAATTSSQGKTYFQRLAPDLQQRFYFDPLLGSKGSLVLIGKFNDVPSGEKYLDLNVLSQVQKEALKDLASATDAKKSAWDTAIDALATKVETFRENPAVAGTYKASAALDQTVGPDNLAVINDSDTAVDSYALTATGKGSGWVTMVFGNGRAFTPEGDPVQVKVFKVVPQLYVGDLKVVLSSNPLDEQAALRHSGDFAGKPQDYEFDWRWTTGAATAPAVYTTSMTPRIGDPAVIATRKWRIVEDPGTMLPSSAQYSAASTSLELPRAQVVRPASHSAADKLANLPTLVLKSDTGVDLTSVPGDIVFSARLGSEDGFILYVNGSPAVAYSAPAEILANAASSTGLVPSGGLTQQFRVPSSFFSAGPNTIEVALYTNADYAATSTLDFRLHAATETDAVAGANTVWQTPSDPTGINKNTAIIGGSPTNPFGGSTFVLNDRWFTMRYRPKVNTGHILATGTTQAEVPYSRWMPPQFVEGWVKRVLAAINPFEQRVKDLANNSVSTDVSVITQAGKRWEGDIALTLGNISDVGLIELYETVLNRAKSMSIDANTNDPDSNNALLLAAGYLNDLYSLLGNEAYADAANPTISVDDQGSSTQVNTSRFSFESQVASSLDEELSLLRGRDDLVSPGVITSPAYNRLFWNYTRGINSGEAIYALNYNIKEKVGSSTADGVIDEADAQRMFPQGHGDAYGHYLTALTGYYRLLSNTNFTWSPRAEAVTVLGQPVTVDFQDERKFAASAANLARTALQVMNLTWRKNYNDNAASGWSHFRDSQPVNTQTGVTRRQGMDEWTSRSTQGALFNWAVGNALLPDNDPYHTGVQKIDRSTVPELKEIAAAAETFQSSIDNANAHLNPLGLSPGAIPFDIDPYFNNSLGQELADPAIVGKGHYEQISIRAVNALNNAAGAFDQAASMTGMLRNQENTLDELNTGIAEQERAYRNELIDIYGSPYSGEIGPGKLYAQSYTGPDLTHWFIVDRPSAILDSSKTFTITVNESKDINAFTVNTFADITRQFSPEVTEATTVTVAPSQFVQYNDIWKPGGLGQRSETGELQHALLDAQQTWVDLEAANSDWGAESINMKNLATLFEEVVKAHEQQSTKVKDSHTRTLALESVKLALETAGATIEVAAAAADDLGDTLAEFFPRSVGLATDATAPARGAAKTAAAVAEGVLQWGAVASQAAAGGVAIGILADQQQLERAVEKIGFSLEEKQIAYEYSVAYRIMVTKAGDIMTLTAAHQRALQNVHNVLARGNRVQAEREVFRQRAAAIIQGYRVRDVSFRLFRNEALEQYRTLFDLASRYTYLAAKSYDYELGLLGTTQGSALFSQVVASRSLGDLNGGIPRLTTSTIGDGGLANVVARLNSDFAVAEGRFGLNNPDHNNTVFSLRNELFRVTEDDAWRQTLERHITSDLMRDPDVANYCRNIKKPDGMPVPGIVIPFSTSIKHAKNFFGLDLAAGDHAYSPSTFATKIAAVGIAFPGYVGTDGWDSQYAAGAERTAAQANMLSATPYVYFIPCGTDYILAPAAASGSSNTLREWLVHDQSMPLPFNLGGSAFNTTQFFNAEGTLREKPWIIRQHQAFRAVHDSGQFLSALPIIFTNARLVARSVWNSQWKLVIPAYTLLSTEQEALNRFTGSVKDVHLFLRTYSHSGN